MGEGTSKSEGRVKAEQIAGVLKNAYKNCNDDRMEQCLQKLSNCTTARETAAAYLYQAIEFRPWDGEYYDPKSWRSDVTKAIKKLYDSETLLRELKMSDTGLANVLFTELKEIFDEPLYALRPVHDLKIGVDSYSFLFTELLELLTEIARPATGNPALTIEDRLHYIQELDEKIEHLARLIKDEKTYGSYSGILGNAYRIRDGLNNE